MPLSAKTIKNYTENNFNFADIGMLTNRVQYQISNLDWQDNQTSYEK